MSRSGLEKTDSQETTSNSNGQIHKLHITPLFHQRARLVFPMVLNVRLMHIGSSSYSIQLEDVDRELNDVLISSTRTFAAMSTITGQSVPFAENVRKQMKPHISQGKNKRVEMLRNFPLKPSGCFNQLAHIRHSDTDNLYHVNQSNYISFCLEAATEATRLNNFKLLRGDLQSYKEKTIECVYKGEAVPGDIVTVHVWQNEKTPEQLFSQIETSNRIIWMGTVSFSLPIEDSLSSRL